MKFEIRNRWSGNVQFTAEIDRSEDTPLRIKVGLAAKWAFKSGADLSGAVLSGADLRGADLRGADLSGAVLSGAVLSGAVLRDADLSGVPQVENIHQKVYEAASQPNALDMGSWHATDACGTTHCRAGWVVALAGEAGRAMEFCMGTPAAAAMIYLASDPKIEKIPDFYCGNTEALEDMKRLAEAEAA
jgi:hypothetical protein